MGLYAGTGNGVIDFAAISEVMQPIMNATFNAEIEIIKPNIGSGSWDRTGNSTTGGGPTVLWTGPARIESLRWPNVASTKQGQAAVRTVVFHIPLGIEVPDGVVSQGYRVRVLDPGLSPAFKDGLFTITSSVNSSYAWDRRIETMDDMGAKLPSPGP